MRFFKSVALTAALALSVTSITATTATAFGVPSGPYTTTPTFPTYPGSPALVEPTGPVGANGFPSFGTAIGPCADPLACTRTEIVNAIDLRLFELSVQEAWYVSNMGSTLDTYYQILGISLRRNLLNSVKPIVITGGYNQTQLNAVYSLIVDASFA